MNALLPVLLAIFAVPLLASVTYAHCPLCTVGVMAAAGGAAWFGINTAVIGLFAGAFAVSLGWWASTWFKKKYVPYQRELLILLSFATTILPLIPKLDAFTPLYVSLMGGYGTLLNRTYLVNLFLVGSLLGGLVMLASPWLSRQVTKARGGKTIPFQGMALTFLLLLVMTGVIQLIAWM